MTRSKSTPKPTLFGFYFLLAFVGAAGWDRVTSLSDQFIHSAGVETSFSESQRCKARQTKCCSRDQRGETIHLGFCSFSCSVLSFQMELRMSDTFAISSFKRSFGCSVSGNCHNQLTF